MTCSVDECNKKVMGAGLCSMHYSRMRRYGTFEFKTTRKFHVPVKCEVESCNNLSYVKTLCQKHYYRKLNTGKLTISQQERGTARSIRPDGYIYITVDGVRWIEHKYLATKALGKPLPPGAEIHHMNEDRQDNFTPFNLIVCPSRAYHKLLHKRMKDLGYVHARNS